MTDENRHHPPQAGRRLQFTLLGLFGVMTVSGVALALAKWLGPALASSLLLVGGFCLVFLGDVVRRNPIIVLGGMAMIGGCVTLVVYGLGTMKFP